MAEDRYSTYRRYINEQKNEYEKAIIEIYKIIQRLQKGISIGSKSLKIKGNVEVEGRIKSFQSAFKNDRIDSKTLDDCFGIRIIGENMIEMSVIQQIIKRLSSPILRRALGDMIDEESSFKIVKEKNHAERLETNYNAIHQILVRNPENPNSPLIEVQYWDKETERRCLYGDLNHISYKKVEKDKQELKEKEIKQGKIGVEIPEYYCFDSEGHLHILDKANALKKLFPEGEADR